MRYVDITEVHAMHRAIIDKTVGTAGVRDFALLHSAVERPKATFGGIDLYPTLWAKAASLLQSLCLNHAFTDGNKRSGAFSFVWFLRKARSKGSRNINPPALTTLTLLIAESDPKKKEQMIALVTRILSR